MNDVLKTAVDVQGFCDRHGWRTCFIGGVAVQRWGEPRVTRDVNLSLITGFSHEGSFLDALLDAFPARIPDARQFAMRNRVLLLESPEGVGIDVVFGALPLEEEIVTRASIFSFAPGLEIRTCSAEDLVVLKLFASRPLDIRDAESVAIRHGESLDWRYIERQLRPLAEAKEDPTILETLAQLRELH